MTGHKQDAGSEGLKASSQGTDKTTAVGGHWCTHGGQRCSAIEEHTGCATSSAMERDLVHGQGTTQR